MKRFAPIAAALLSLLFYVIVFAQDIEGTVNKGANLRSGPGTAYAIVGKAKQGQVVTIADKNTAGDWYQLYTGEWIAAFLVTLDAEIPVTATPTRRAATPTATKVISPTIAATNTPQSPKINLRTDPVSVKYASDVYNLSFELGSASRAFSSVFKEYRNNRDLGLSSTWRSRFFETLIDLQVVAESARELIPGSYFMDAHNDLLIMADNLDDAADLYVEAIGTGERDTFLVAGTALETAYEYAGSGVEKMVALARKQSIPFSSTPTVQPVATSTPAISTGGLNYEITQIASKVTESNDIYEKHAWILDIKNNENRPLLINATVDFEDADGFIISQDFQYGLYIGPNETKRFTGLALILIDVSLNVVNVAVNTTATVTQ